MKSLNLKKLVATVVAVATIATMSPIGASAAWKQDSNGWWNTEGSSYSTGWRTINNAWYYFGSNGYMKTGWVNDNGTWYYTTGSGAMKTGWVNTWVNNKCTWYYTTASGAMRTGWVNDNGNWYYTDASGAMKTGWVNDNGVWYFTSVSGAMQTGIVEIEGKVYCLAPSGAMQTGNVLIDGKTYTFAVSGEAVGEIPKASNSFSWSGITVTSSNSGNKDKEDKEEKTSGGGGGSHGGSHSRTTEEKINDAYRASAKLNITNNGNGQYTIKFVKQGLDKRTYDYVTRDFYVTNREGKSDNITVEPGNEAGVYVVKNTKGAGIKVKGVVRVCEEGKIYYVTEQYTK